MLETKHTSIREQVLSALKRSSNDKNLNITWKPIPRYEGIYEVNQNGDVRRLPYTVTYVDRRPEVTEPRTMRFDYIKLHPYYYKNRPLVSLRSGDVTKPKALDKIVATVFVDNPNHFIHLIHKDHDCTNNRASNLKWCSIKEYKEHHKKDPKK